MPGGVEKEREEGQSGPAEKRVDEGWKEEAKREKEKLAGQPGGAKVPLPEPSIELIVTHFAIQALIALGDIANPVTRKQERDLDQAKHSIDLLGVLEEKTRGNLSEDEKRHLEGTLYDLRMRYVSMAHG
jgi:hypothetical protein